MDLGQQTMQVISEQGNYRISSSFGASIAEGTDTVGTNGPIISFEIAEIQPQYGSFWYRIEPIKGSHADFWDDYLSNAAGGAPATEFANSGFTAGGIAQLKINPDNVSEPDEEFRIAFYVEPSDAYTGGTPVATAQFKVLNDDQSPVAHVDPTPDNGVPGRTIIAHDAGGTLVGGPGNDVFVGGAGVDVASYAGSSAGFRHLFAVSGSSASDVFAKGLGAAAAEHGTDTLHGIEQIEFIDGRLVFDNDAAAATVLRMYDAMFAREPDRQGFEYWTSALEHGTDVQNMASFFASSPEFVQRYGALGNQSFVEQLYQNVLGRAGEKSGVEFWANELSSGALNRGQVLAGFSESAEHKDLLRPTVQQGLWDVDDTAAQAARVYSAAFDRNPDAAGLTFWTNGLKSGTQSAASMTDFFVQSAEFGAKYGTLNNAQFVDQLYHNVLDRAGETAGIAYWTGALDHGQLDRGDVLLGFSESAENVSKTLPTMTDGIMLA